MQHPADSEAACWWHQIKAFCVQKINSCTAGGHILAYGQRLFLFFMLALTSHLSWSESPSEAKLDSDIRPSLSCDDLLKEDFTRIADAPTSLLQTKVVTSEGASHSYCAVKGVIQPTIQFEMRLPLDSWNGRYFQTGCGGFCGIVRINECNDMLMQGYVTAAHDMGHTGHPIREPVWGSDKALRDDFGGRSTHLMSVVGKEIAHRFYGSKPARAYFRGCSTGGREGLTLAQKYPEDFDGIISGDPAFAGRLGAIANNWDAQQLLRADGSDVFSREALQILHSAVLKQCDALDGLTDGILMDPRKCQFDPASLACDDNKDAAECLTQEQVLAAKRLYEGPVNSQGVALMPGATPMGSELSWSGAGRRSLSEGYLRYLAFEENPPADYNYRNFDFDNDIAKVEKSAALYDPVAPYEAPDLSRFAELGGKLIVYHGWADAGVSPYALLDYYAHVSTNYGGLDKTQSWFRVFMVPGMFHCRGGDAPNKFDFVPHMIRWVEQNAAPERVVATQYQNEQVVRTRPLFPYPAFATYQGAGDVNEQQNWKAKLPEVPSEDHRDWIWAPKD